MRLEESLFSSVKDHGDIAREVWIGLHWMAVEGKWTGLAHTYKTGRKHFIEDEGQLSGRPSLELARRIFSWEPVEASVGVAALNSCIEPRGDPGNVSSIIKREAEGKTLTVIGRFPFNDDISRRARKARFLEIEPKAGEFPAAAAEELLPGSDVNVITATTLINHTLQRLLELGDSGLNIVLGPSTPMSPSLFVYGADILAGVKVVERDPLIRSVTQGAKRFNNLKGMEPITLQRRDVDIRGM